VLSHRPVIVLQLPEQLDSVGARAFIEELNPLLDFPGPRDWYLNALKSDT
jgi:hypothetical protein